jgi:hypothetical protein
MMMMMKMR